MRIPHPNLPPMWRETRVGFELAGLLRSDVWRGDGVTAGNGQPVMLVSGLLAGDQSMNLMARWLQSTGHRPCRAGIASIYSRTDGVVEWRACLDPAAEVVEVRASHIGMAVNAEAYRAVAASLEGLRAAEAARAPGRRTTQRRHLRLAA